MKRSKPEPLPSVDWRDRDALLAEIDRAFDGVSRDGGTSWGRAETIEMTSRNFLAIPFHDRDTRWQDLIDDEDWSEEEFAHWVWLDPIGFRYYLPVALTRMVKDGATDLVMFDGPLRKPDEDELGRLSLLDTRQLRCVKFVILHIRANAESTGEWGRARILDRSLRRFLDRV